MNGLLDNPNKKSKIVVVDNNLEGLKFKRQLSDLGLSRRVDVLKNGQEAIEYFDEIHAKVKHR